MIKDIMETVNKLNASRKKLVDAFIECRQELEQLHSVSKLVSNTPVSEREIFLANELIRISKEIQEFDKNACKTLLDVIEKENITLIKHKDEN